MIKSELSARSKFMIVVGGIALVLFAVLLSAMPSPIDVVVVDELQIITNTTIGRAALGIYQNDHDQPFINYNGTVGIGTTYDVNICYGSTPSVCYLTTESYPEGYIRVQINGVSKWIPFYGEEPPP